MSRGGYSGGEYSKGSVPRGNGTQGEPVPKGWVFGVSLFRVWVFSRLSTWGVPGGEYPGWVLRGLSTPMDMGPATYCC